MKYFETEKPKLTIEYLNLFKQEQNHYFSQKYPKSIMCTFDKYKQFLGL